MVLGFLADTLDFIVLAFADFAFTGLRFAALERVGFAFNDFTFVVFVFALAFLAMIASHPLSISHPLVDRDLNSFSLLAVTSDDKVSP